MSDNPHSLPVIQPNDSSGVPLIFEKVAIIGLGLIGGSIALAARQTWPTGLIIGVDNKNVLERAMVRHAIDVAAEDPVVIAEADLVILAAPVQQNIELIASLAQHLSHPAIVTDVSSTKREIVEAASGLPSHLTFVGGHPLAGAPRGGIDRARQDLFVGRPWLFTSTDDAMGDTLDRLRQFVTALGANAHVMSVTEHDHLLAYLSHLPQLVASTLMHVVGSEVGERGLALAGRGLVDTTRLSSSSVTIWQDICATNINEIGSALDVFIAELKQIREQLGQGEALDRVFDSAIKWRSTLATKRRERGMD